MLLTVLLHCVENRSVCNGVNVEHVKDEDIRGGKFMVPMSRNEAKLYG